MAAICKNQQGFLLISSLFTLSVILIIVSFYLSGILQEERVAQITGQSPQTYYLSEAAMSEVLWKLGHDSNWKNNFENNETWTATISRSNVLTSGGGYTATIVNQGTGNAVITATSTIAFREGTAQRVVQMAIFKPLNINPVNGVTLFANDDIKVNGAKLSLTGGDIFTNEDLELEYFSNWTSNDDVKAVDQVTVGASSSLSAASIKDKDDSPAPSTIKMITIDFASGESTSYFARANQVYTASQFAQLLLDNPVLTLNGITYITGNVHLKPGQSLTVNGALVADGSITVGASAGGAGAAILDVNKVGTEPSGLLSRKNIVVGGYAAAVTIDGLVYSGGNFRVQDGDNQDVDFTVTGGVFAQSVEFYNLWDPITFTHNQSYINDARPVSAHSQTVIVNRWEEEY